MYAELYQGMPDVLGGDYRSYLDPFGAESGTAPAELCDLVLDSGTDIPKVFVYLAADPPAIRVLHRPTHYAPTLGRTTAWDNAVYAFGTDVGPGNLIGVLQWPQDAFARTVQVHVPTVATVAAQWTAAAGADCLGPYNLGDADTEAVRTRFLCPVPQAYASQVIRRQEYSPRGFWTDVIQLLIADGRQLGCQALVDWARVASTYQVGAGPTLPASHRVAPTAPASDQALLTRVWSWVVSDLPALSNRAGTAAGAVAMSMASLHTEFAQQRADAAAARAAASAPKTPAEKYPQTIGGVRRLCECATDADLPQVWHVLANASKKEGLYAVQALVDTRADALGRVSPVVSPELFLRISEARLAAVDMDDLSAGLSPFLIAVGAGAAASDARQRAQTFSLLHGNDAAPVLSDICDLSSDAPYMATSLTECLYVYQGYSVLLDVLLGAPHWVSTLFREQFLPGFNRRVLDITNQVEPAQLPAMIPLFLRHTQLCMMHYFQEAYLSGANAALPLVMDLLSTLSFRTYTTLPTLPHRYLAPLPAPPSLPPTGPGSGGPRSAPIAPADNRPAAQQVTNTAPESALMRRFTSYGQRLRTLTDLGHPQPRVDNGTGVLCLSWHLRGQCNTMSLSSYPSCCHTS